MIYESLAIIPSIQAKIEAVVAAHRKVREPVTTLHLGHSFCVNPGVFSPFVAPSGQIGLAFASQPDFRGKTILDIGCGSGVIACLMALSGAARVVGVDINATAVENARQNGSNLHLTNKTDFRVGRLFQPVEADEIFDVILADLPFTNGTPKDMIEAAFYDPGLNSIRELISELPARLRSPNSRAYVCLSDFDGDELPALIEQSGLFQHHFICINADWINLRMLEIGKE